MNADATILPPAETDVASCDDDAPINEADLEEAFTIAAGDTPLTPERRHLVALTKAYDEALDLAVGFHTYVDRRGRQAGAAS